MSTTTKESPESSIRDSEKDYWAELYTVAEHWQTDLKFYEDEIRFLKKLIDKYFLWLLDEKNLEGARSLVNKLSKLEKDRLIVDEKVVKHMHHLTALVENPFPHDAAVYKTENSDLKTAFAGLLKEFRAVKNDIFEMAEHAIESSKAKHLIDTTG